MKIYWSLQTIPELANVSPQTQRSAWRACCFKPFHHWRFVVGWILWFVFFIGVVQRLLKSLFHIFSHEPLSRAGEDVIVMICGGLAGFIAYQFLVAGVRPYLHTFLENDRLARIQPE